MRPWSNKQASKSLDTKKDFISPGENKHLLALKKLVGVTQADFENLYITTINRFAEFHQAAKADDVINKSLGSAILALKKRQGYLLPQGADSETVFQQREVWTYAIFTAALLRHIETTDKLSLARALLPGKAYRWLARHTELYTIWRATLNDEATIIAEILGVNNAVPQRCVENKKLKPEPPPKACENNTVKEHSVPKSKFIPNSKAKIKEINLENLDEGLDKREKQVASPNSDDSAKIDVFASSKHHDKNNLTNDLTRASIDDFLAWLKEAIIDKSISININDSVLHGTKQGLLIIMPGIIKQFIEANTNKFTTSKASLISELKQSKCLVKNAKGSSIHSYCLGPWQERRTLSGFMLNKTELLGKEYQFSINPDLNLDPLSNS